jgi:cytoskeletal protein RodZ
MQKIGTVLKQIREEKNLTLEDINDKTRIRIDYLQDIESNAFRILNNFGVARAIFHNYGTALGLSEKEILYSFDDTFPHVQGSTFTAQKNIKEKKILISFNLLYLIGISILVMIIALTLVNLYKKGSLGSPFKKRFITTETKVVPESLNSAEKFKETKPDEKREMMKQLKEKVDVKEPDKKPISSQSLYDNTDYTKELIFDNKDSVLETD